MMKKFLTSIFLGLLIAGFTLASAPAVGQVREVKERLDLDRSGRVSIKNHKGSIRVSTWNRSEVDIRVEIEAGGNSRREQEWVEETEIRINGNGQSVRIKTDYRNFQNRSFWGGGNSPYVHYIIRIPESAELKISDHKSEITVTGVGGELRLDTHKGTVEVEDQSGPVILKTHKGNVRVEFSDFPDNSRFETHKGDIEIVLHEESEFDLEVDIDQNGHLTSDFDLGRRHGRSRRWRDDDDEQRFHVAVNGGGPRLRLSSHQGYFRLKQR